MKRIPRTLRLGLFCACFLGSVPRAQAIDHSDSTTPTANPPADLADVFAWMSTDGTKVILAMTVNPNATAASRFATDTMYVFHTASRSSVLSTSVVLADIVCSFDSAQKIACAVGDGSVTVSGDASPTTGLARSDGKLKVFAGLRRDPSFANIAGIANLRQAAKSQFAALQPSDPAGCKIPSNQLALVSLRTNPVNTFQSASVLALVLEVDKTLLNRGGPVLSVWAATHKKTNTN